MLGVRAQLSASADFDLQQLLGTRYRGCFYIIGDFFMSLSQAD
jgi:hypothetical protein